MFDQIYNQGDESLKYLSLELYIVLKIKVNTKKKPNHCKNLR